MDNVEIHKTAYDNKWLWRLSAVVIWIYCISKVFIFDIDRFLIEKISADYLWILNYKLVFFLFVFCLLLWCGKTTKVLLWLAYVICFPILLLLWLIPKKLYLNLPVAIIIAPAIYDLFSNLRRTTICFCLALVGIIISSLSENKLALYASLFLLQLLIILHLWHAVKLAYSENIFNGLLSLIRIINKSIDNGSMKETLFKKKDNDSELENEKHQPLVSTYMLNQGFEILAEKVEKIKSKRIFDLYLLGRILQTLVIVILAYSFEYFCIYKIDALSFSYNDAPSYWSFLSYSISSLLPVQATTVTANSALAIVIAYSESFCSILIFCIIVFTFLTAARESYNQGLDKFIEELRFTANSIVEKSLTFYGLTLENYEETVFRLNSKCVNQIRKYRDFPPLNESKDEPDPE